MNIAMFTGNLGKDAEMRMAGTHQVLNFSIAVKSGYGDKAQTLWIDCAKFGESAKLAPYLRKGTQVCVAGELGTRTHENKTYLTLKVDKIDLIGGKLEAANTTSTPTASYQASNNNGSDITEPLNDLPF